MEAMRANKALAARRLVSPRTVSLPVNVFSRMTLSPGRNPLTISRTFAEALPNFTFTRTAWVPFGSTPITSRTP